ncbi:MAG: hypothetical protein OEV93_02185 [Candidatus Moranbacteria bacterium]|nr:hypothetical protein [Candidatus Moranbacteria bacterium]
MQNTKCKILNIKYKRPDTRNGFSIILAVVFVGAVSLTILLSFLALGRVSISGSLVFSKSVQARTLTESCVETALQEIRNETTFSGSGNILIEDNECSYEVIDNGAEDREIRAEGVVDDVVHRIVVTADKINPQINIVSWERIDNF